jgi:hypothetical protein
MSMNFALGLAFGQKMAEQAGIEDVGARRRAGIVLGALGLTPAGLLFSRVMIDRQAEQERLKAQALAEAEGGGKAKASFGRLGSGAAEAPATEDPRKKP